MFYARDCVIENLTIKDVYDWYHIELNASHDIDVMNAELEGLYRTRGTLGHGHGTEMIQIEPADNSAVLRDEGGTTSCENILIEDCSLVDELGGDPVVAVGNDGGFDKPGAIYIEILNSEFEDLETGINPYGLEDVLTKDNVFTNVDEPITDEGEDVTEEDNSF